MFQAKTSNTSIKDSTTSMKNFNCIKPKNVTLLKISDTSSKDFKDFKYFDFKYLNWRLLVLWLKMSNDSFEDFQYLNVGLQILKFDTSNSFIEDFNDLYQKLQPNWTIEM